jgi:hypothetical protein
MRFIDAGCMSFLTTLSQRKTAIFVLFRFHLTSCTRLADLIGFDGYLNQSAPFLPEEHQVVWKSERRYPDFSFNNDKPSACTYPRFWDDSGSEVLKNAGSDNFSKTFDKLETCYDSEFDQVGRLVIFVHLSMLILP